jgi:hypothetical protein
MAGDTTTLLLSSASGDGAVGVEHGDEELAGSGRVELHAHGLRAGPAGAQRPQDRFFHQLVALVEGLVGGEEDPDEGGGGGLGTRVVHAEHALHDAPPLVVVPAVLRHACHDPDRPAPVALIFTTKASFSPPAKAGCSGLTVGKSLDAVEPIT